MYTYMELVEEQPVVWKKKFHSNWSQLSCKGNWTLILGFPQTMLESGLGYPICKWYSFIWQGELSLLTEIVCLFLNNIWNIEYFRRSARQKFHKMRVLGMPFVYFYLVEVSITFFPFWAEIDWNAVWKRMAELRLASELDIRDTYKFIENH